MFSKNLTLDFVRRFWLFSIAFCATQVACCNSITLVYAYQHIADKDRALLMLITGGCTYLVYSLAKKKIVKQWVCTHYTFMALVGIVVDGGTELALLRSAFTKFVCDFVCLATFFKFYRIQMIERMAAMFSGKDRSDFDIDVSRADAIGVVAGGTTAYLSPSIPIEYVIWISAIWTVITYITSWIRFRFCDNYMQQNGIQLPCMKEDEEED